MTGNDKNAIVLSNVSKKFRLFSSPKERFKELFHPLRKQYHKEFWALKDINLEVPKGTTIGIVGRNGSGKSTLLQIICSIMKPTIGDVTVNGRISALLELGAGFNPELSGRDNVFLNGAMMGFTKKEISERLPEIEDFADIGEFVDQPVKTYSSGMFVRLAFAAAINVDPDILIVDEALSVGDAKFQGKCYNKFHEFKDAGKTIVLVTHDGTAVINHCDHALLLESGEVIQQGGPKDIVDSYYELIFTGVTPADKEAQEAASILSGRSGVHGQDDVGDTDLESFIENVPVSDNCPNRKGYNKNEHRYGSRKAEIVDFLVLSGDRVNPDAINSGDMVDIYLKVRFRQGVKNPLYGFSIKTIDGIGVYGTNTRFYKSETRPVKAHETVIYKFSVKMSLHKGDYFISLGVADKLFIEDDPLDTRAGLIHLVVREKNRFDGFIELNTTIEEVCAEQRR